MVYDKSEDAGVPVIKASYDSKKEWILDKKGFFTIKPFPEEGIIRVRYYKVTPQGHKKVSLIEGKTAEEIVQTIVREKLVSSLQHIAYLGSELQKAEVALKLNLEFVQDSPLDFSKLEGDSNKN